MASTSQKSWSFWGMFLRLRTARLKLSPNKCHLFQKRVAYLGHIVGEEGVSTDPAKIRSVVDWPAPRTIGRVRSFLGLSSYYRRFVRGFADIAKPLYTLTERSNQPFQWTSESEQAFQMLKEVLMRAPVLAYPTREDPFVLDTDASNKGIGAVLSQIQDGQERVVAYYSRVLHKAERRYCVTRKELLGVVEGVRNFHHYLYGKRFLVRTDHGALQWLLNFRNPEGELARWLEELGTYDMDIQHRSGRQHGNADAPEGWGPLPTLGVPLWERSHLAVGGTGDAQTSYTASSGPPRPNQKWSTTIGWSRTQATTTQLGFFHLLGMTSTSKVADQGPWRTHRLRTSSVGNQGPWWTLRLRTSSVGNQGPWWTQTPDEQRGEPGALVDSQSSRSAPSQVSARPRRDVRPLKWTRDFVLNT